MTNAKITHLKFPKIPMLKVTRKPFPITNIHNIPQKNHFTRYQHLTYLQLNFYSFLQNLHPMFALKINTQYTVYYHLYFFPSCFKKKYINFMIIGKTIVKRSIKLRLRFEVRSTYWVRNVQRSIDCFFIIQTLIIKFNSVN